MQNSEIQAEQTVQYHNQLFKVDEVCVDGTIKISPMEHEGVYIFVEADEIDVIH